MDNLAHTVNDLVQTVSIYALPVLFAITLHEAAHGYVARHFGDMTAHAQGRISLNPMRHVDVIGTIVVPLIILVLSGGRFLFGWAKPVPVNYSALRKPRQHMAWVAAAGPLANLVMALLWALLLKLAVLLPPNFFSVPLRLMSEAGIVVNLVFMFLNLLPILPLRRRPHSRQPAAEPRRVAIREARALGRAAAPAAAGDERPQLRA